MDSVQKMVLVEPRVFENMKERQHEEYPLVSAMSSLDVEMNAVISGSNLPTEDKARLYDPWPGLAAIPPHRENSAVLPL